MIGNLFSDFHSNLQGRIKIKFITDANEEKSYNQWTILHAPFF